MAEAPAYPSLGGYDDEFVNKVEEDLQCVICQLPLKEPILTKCGHRFCRKCLDGYFGRLEREGQPLSCPVDRDNLMRDKEYIFPDKATERKIMSLFIKCPSDGCQWTCELRSKEDHLASCPLKVVSCTNDNCPMSLPRKDLQGHVTATCEWRIVRCSHCNAPHPTCETEAHQAACKGLPLNCPNNCGAVIAREEISAHVEEDCPLTIISCRYAQMGCAAKFQRREIESHLNSASILHLDLVCVKLNDTQVQLRETQIQLRNTQGEFKETKREVEKFNALENRLLQFPDTHTWKVTKPCEYAHSIRDSRPFYSHGYKFRLSLHLNGEKRRSTHLSISFIVIGDGYETVLSWPFHKKVTYTLIDQQEDPNDRENFVRSFTAEIDKTDLTTRGRHIFEFISLDDVKKRRYVVDNTMLIQVQVDPPE